MANIKGNKHYSYQFKIKVVKDIIKYKSFTYSIKKYNISSNSATKWYNHYLLGTLNENNTGKHYNQKRLIDIDCKCIENLSSEQRSSFENILILKSKNWTRIEKYLYINKTKQNISYLCKLLNIARSSYYKWCTNGKNIINAYKKSINNIVVEEFNFHKIKFGYRRLKQQILRNYGENLSEYYVRKYMKLNNLQGNPNKKRKHTITKNVKQLQKTPNIINGKFRSGNKNEKWYMDYTFVRTNNKFLYVLLLLDGYNKEIINYRIVSHKTPRVTKNMLIQSINKINSYSNLVIHNDQGCEFNNNEVNSYLINKGIKQSFSKKASPLQNALIESTMSTFKRDFNPENEKIVNKKHLQSLVSEFVYYYNHLIPQKVLNYKVPSEY